MRHAVAKVTGAGNPRVFVTERGTSFGYNNLVVDMRAFPMMRELGSRWSSTSRTACSCRAAATASRPAWPQYIEPLASAGVAAGVDGVFLEVHDDPARAKSDAQNALRLDRARAAARSASCASTPSSSRRTRRPTVSDAVATTVPDADLALARKVLQTEADAILALVDRARRARSTAPSTCSPTAAAACILTGMGKSGIICRKIAATLSSTGTPAFFLHPAEAIHGDLGVIQGDDVVIALSYSGETDEILRLLETIRRAGREADRHHRLPGLDAGAGGRRHARLPRRRGGVPAEPRADGEHDGRARARRRAGDDAAGRARGSGRRTSPTCTPAASWASG